MYFVTKYSPRAKDMNPTYLTENANVKNVDEVIPYNIHFDDPKGDLLKRNKKRSPNVEKRMSIDSKRMKRDCVNRALSEIIKYC